MTQRCSFPDTTVVIDLERDHAERRDDFSSELRANSLSAATKAGA
jgi:hypothetical protein